MSAPKLNIHCKSLFLTHQSDKVFAESRDDKIPASEFFKCLLISKQFLRASQLYNIYEIVIREFCDNNKFNLRLSRCGGTWSEDFQLTLEEIQQLNKLLHVKCVNVFQYCYKHANQYSEVCKIFKGKIGLRLVLDNNKNEVRHHQIITQVKDQLFSLRCGAKSLLGSSKVPHLNLSYCACWEIENLYQVKQLLTNHQIRKLVINNIYGDSDLIFNETIDDDYFDDFPKCPRVKTLSFLLTQLDENYKLLPKLIKMVSFFPNLMKMHCCFNTEHYTSEQFSSQQLLDRVAKECKTIEQLRKACPLNTSFDLTHRFRIRRAEPLLTVKQTIKHFLKTTKFNQLHFFRKVAEEVTNDDIVSMRYYYLVIIKWIEPNFESILCFEGDLDPLTMGNNEVIEEDDNLVVPLFDRYEPD